ncbi:MAG: DNA recombination protein RmuC [Alphaproteobacteria bacterium]|nr:DNA recombination protein RmuC [Alphaproteobacteria bacterium]
MSEAIPIAVLYAGAGFLAGAIVTALYFMARAGHMNAQFQLAAQEAVKNAHETFLQLARENFKTAQADGAHDLDKRHKAIDDMVKPVQKQLEALSGALEQVKGTDAALREDLKNLGRETAKLVGALRDPAAQGQWGEFILEGLLEKSGLMKGVHYETQVSMATAEGRQRPDAVIRMQDGFNIIIDAKAPLNEFAQRLAGDISEDDHNALMQNLARQVREHVKKLGQKGYWENLESPDFTVMFVPSEQIYSIALRADPDLPHFAAERAVIIASPTLLISLLRVVSLSWRQMELAKNAQTISDYGLDLYKRLLKFTEHVEKIGKNLQSAMKGYDEAVGSLERSVLPSARKFRELQGGANDLPEFTPVEQAPRYLSLSAEDEEERRKRA